MGNAFKWTAELEDEFLNAIIPCESELFYSRAMVAFARNFGRDARIGLDEGDQYLRRRAVRRTDYQGPSGDRTRLLRVGLPFSWVEKRILNWAQNKTNAESTKDPYPEYLANLLCRSTCEIVQELDRRVNTRNGIPAFF